MANKSHNLSMVLPMYNEEGNVVALLAKLDEVRRLHNLDMRIIAVNDGSTDNTLRVLREEQKKYPHVEVIDNGVNKGLAQTLRNGIKHALDQGGELMGFMDSDLTHDPGVLPFFLEKIDTGYDFVVGSRYIPGGKMEGVPAFRAIVSILGNTIARFLLRIPIRDFTGGYRVIRSEVFRKITVEENGFGIQLEEVVKAHAAGFRLGEVPVILKNRTYGKSSMRYNLPWVWSYVKLFVRCMRWLYGSKRITS